MKKYKYPPEGQEDALNTVITQCELWTDNEEMFREMNEGTTAAAASGDVANELYFTPAENTAYGIAADKMTPYNAG